MGSVISALFVQLATYHWIFWFITIMSLPFALLLFLLTSNDDEDVGKHLQSHKQKLKNLDLTGVTLLTVNRAVERPCTDKSLAVAALILFIYSVTTATGAGWGTAQVLAPLIISVFMVAVFFIWEAKVRVPAERASVIRCTCCEIYSETLKANVSFQTAANVVPAQCCSALGCIADPLFWWDTAINISYNLGQDVFG